MYTTKWTEWCEISTLYTNYFFLKKIVIYWFGLIEGVVVCISLFIFLVYSDHGSTYLFHVLFDASKFDVCVCLWCFVEFLLQFIYLVWMLCLS